MARYFDDAYIDDLLGQLAQAIWRKSSKKCHNIETGNFNCDFLEIEEITILADIIKNHPDCIQSDEAWNCIIDRVQDFIDTCNITGPVLPAQIVVPSCDDNNVLTENLFCIITEQGEFVIIE